MGSPRLWLVLLPEARGMGAAVLKPRSLLNRLPRVSSGDAFKALGTPQPVAGKHAHAPRAPPRETKDETKADKVERLTDNRRGLSVAIYNRDWEMVNQM